jgi:hypothetical protein
MHARGRGKTCIIDMLLVLAERLIRRPCKAGTTAVSMTVSTIEPRHPATVCNLLSRYTGRRIASLVTPFAIMFA